MSRPRMVLEAKRLLLREMKPDDYQALFRVLGSPETMLHYPYTFDGQHVRDEGTCGCRILSGYEKVR